MGKKEREHGKHVAGGPDKSARKGHAEPEWTGNEPTQQRQAGPGGLPGEGRDGGPQRREPDKTEKSG